MKLKEYAILYLKAAYGNLKACLFSEEQGLSEQKVEKMVRPIKIIVEKHADGYVAYPLGLQGVVVGEGGSYEEALNDVKSAIRFHIETFGPDIFGL